MAAIDFPTAPTNLQQFAAANGVVYEYRSTPGLWIASNSPGTTYAPLASPVFTGNPQAPTPTAGDNDTSIATTAFVNSAVGAVAKPVYVENATAGSKTGPVWVPVDVLPPNTMGVQLFSQAFTALNAAHRIRVRTGGQALQATSGERFTTALYIDGVAVRSQITYGAAANYDVTCDLNWEGVLSAGAHTYAVRLATQLTGTFAINGPPSGRWGGGSMAWTLSIEELNAP